MNAKLYGAVSAVTLAAAMAPALASAQAPTETTASSIEEIVVTGSRVARVGFQAPTPITSVSAEQLQTASPGNIGEALRQLPILGSSRGPRGATGSSGSGGAFLNLRALGQTRTLTLLDGHRFVPSAGDGTVDTALFPQGLISRVEIVTGGASAAYGSDAVAGVVNFILDKTFTGLKGEVMYGTADRGDTEEKLANMTYGRELAGGRGHFLASAELYRNAGLYDRLQREHGRRSCEVIANPAGPTARTFACDVRSSVANFGGLISAGPLRGTTFDSASNPIAFNFGTLTSSNTQVGGDGIPIQFIAMELPAKRATIFTRGSWDFTDTISGFVELNYGATEYEYQVGSYSQNMGSTAITIQRDNAYITPAFRNTLIANNINSFRIGRYSRDIPRTWMRNLNYTTRAVAGLDGSFGDVKWSLHYQHGENRRGLDGRYAQNLDKFQEAADAVVAPNGQIVCRSTLTNPGNGCVPVNFLGESPKTPAQIAYITGTNWATSKTVQDTAAIEVNYEPFTLPAGPVSLAGGLEYRKETLNQVGDPVSLTFSNVSGAQGPYRLGNYRSQAGKYDVREGFLETVVPVLKDMPMAQSLELNAAVRRTDYSTSGGVTTWKVGATYSPIQGVRFRGTRSRDIRAPNLIDLYESGSTNRSVTFLDQFYSPPRTLNQVLRIGSGNPDLQPEVADTLTYGVVLSPTFAPGLDISLDAYDVEINDAIAVPDSSRATLDCRNGSTVACTIVSRDTAGNILVVFDKPINFQTRKNSGADIEVAYRFNLENLLSIPGDFNVRWLGNYVHENYTVAPGATTIDRTGDASQPKWRWNVRAAYRNGPLNVAVSGRYTGSGPFDSSTAANDLPQRNIKGQFLVDTRVSYDFDVLGGAYTAFLNVQNITDTMRPDFGAYGQYDDIGRYIRVGFNFKY